MPPPRGLPEISFETRPGWGVELDAHAGIAILTRSEARGAFAFAGGLLRGHYQYFELGGFYDHADSSSTGGTLSHIGGFAGAWLPYHNWVDFDAALGLGVRRYTDSDTRYGPSGYDQKSAALSLMLGVSDRSGDTPLAARVGGQFVLTYDFSQVDKPWVLFEANDAGDIVATRGQTHVGGLSLSLVFTIGLDVAGQ